MPLTSLEFKELLSRFDDDLIDVSDELYEAVTEDVSQEQHDAALAAGRRKLEEYAGLLGQLEGIKRTQAVELFGEHMDKIRERVKTLSES
jgi:hypothetical protein